MKILVTGFDPFGGETTNPSIECVKRLPDEIANAKIIKLEIPTIAYTALDKIHQAIQEYHPDMVLSIGQAGGRSDISIERIGINLHDFIIKDNGGNQPIDTPIFENGPAAYFASLPIKAMVENIRRCGIPASISNTAGTFVCNHVLYGVRHVIETQNYPIKSGFLHIPYLPTQVIDKVEQPSMPLDDIIVGVTAAIEAMIQYKTDIQHGEGTIC